MRLFAAIGFPGEWIVELRRMQDALRSLPWRASFPGEFHLTLLFMGEVPESRLPGLKSALSGIRFEGFDIALHDIGVFPSGVRPRVVWAGVDDGGRLGSLAEDIISASGMKPDKPFQPHITLARVKHVADKEPVLRAIGALHAAPLRFRVSSFSLIRSTLLPTGPVYEDLEEYRAEGY